MQVSDAPETLVPRAPWMAWCAAFPFPLSINSIYIIYIYLLFIHIESGFNAGYIVIDEAVRQAFFFIDVALTAEAAVLRAGDIDITDLAAASLIYDFIFRQIFFC